MMSKTPAFQRHQVTELAGRLAEARRFLQVVTGPRQVGKTTMVWQVLQQVGLPSHYASADEPALKDGTWLVQQWETGRLLDRAGEAGAILVLDEIQKIVGWSEVVKRLWDEDTHAGSRLRCVVLGSAPLLMARGLSESLAGRFETVHLPHWSFAEMRDAFGWDVDTYVIFGGYPGAASLVGDMPRWRRYILDSLVETSISRDVLLLTRVDKPALLRRLFDLACTYSGQVLSYTKMAGQLQDAGNTTTLAHYLDLLEAAGMVRGIPKFSGDVARSRSSSPKLQVMNMALMTAQAGIDPRRVRGDPASWGRLAESAVGAHLANAAAGGACEVFYWRDRGLEVDFVVRAAGRIAAIEVRSGAAPGKLAGSRAFGQRFAVDRFLLVGSGGIPLERFLVSPVEAWLGN